MHFHIPDPRAGCICRHIWAWIVLFAAIASALPARAQDQPYAHDPNDPIAGLTNFDVPFERADEPELPVVAGAHLSAWPGVREEQNTQTISFADGYAHVRVEAVIASRARRSGVATYSVPLPANAVVRSCAPVECPSTSSVELAVATRDGTDALPSRTIVVVEYSVPLTYRGGVARFVIPSRGTDNRLARTTIHLAPLSTRAQAPPSRTVVDGTVPSVSSPVSLDAHREIEIEHVIDRQPGRSAWSSSIRVRGQVREHVLVLPQEPSPQNLHLLLDVSPSARGPVRGVVTRALAALLGLAPLGTTATVHAFASRAQTVISDPMELSQVSLSLLFDSLELELGGTTQFGRVWNVIAPRVHRGDVVLIVGDGTIGTSAADRSALDAIVRRGARLIAISGEANRSAHDLAIAADKTGGRVIELGLGRDQPASADSWLREELAEIFTRPVARIGRRVVPSGSSDTWVRAAGTSRALTFSGTGMYLAQPHVASEGAFERQSRAARSSSPPDASQVERRTGIAAETILYQLRVQLVPLARACFRADRAGRAQYSSRAVFAVSIERGEISRAEVDARPNAMLRCMTTALEDLRLPYSTSVINVRYPLVTRPERPDEPVELTSETRQSILQALE